MFKRKDEDVEKSINRLQICVFIMDKVCEMVNNNITFVSPEGFENPESASRYAIINDRIFLVDVCIDADIPINPRVFLQIEEMITFSRESGFAPDRYRCDISYSGRVSESYENNRTWSDSCNESIKQLWEELQTLENIVQKEFGEDKK